MRIFSFFQQWSNADWPADKAPFSWLNRPSLFEFIEKRYSVARADDHDSLFVLPDFSQPHTNHHYFWPGELDAQLMLKPQKQIKSAKHTQQLCKFLLQIAQNPLPRTEEMFYNLVLQSQTIAHIESIEMFVSDQKLFLNQHLKRFASRLFYCSADRECLKMGVFLLSIIGDDQTFEDIKLIGLHEEFTFYTLFYTNKRELGIEKTAWEMAHFLSAWGKVHATEILSKSTNPVILQWLLLHGHEGFVQVKLLIKICILENMHFLTLLQKNQTESIKNTEHLVLLFNKIFSHKEFAFFFQSIFWVKKIILFTEHLTSNQKQINIGQMLCLVFLAKTLKKALANDLLTTHLDWQDRAVNTLIDCHEILKKNAYTLLKKTLAEKEPTTESIQSACKLIYILKIKLAFDAEKILLQTPTNPRIWQTFINFSTAENKFKIIEAVEDFLVDFMLNEKVNEEQSYNIALNFTFKIILQKHLSFPSNIQTALATCALVNWQPYFRLKALQLIEKLPSETVKKHFKDNLQIAKTNEVQRNIKRKIEHLLQSVS